MKQEKLSETEAIKETLKAFIEATEELNRSYNQLKQEVNRLSQELATQKNLLKAIIESIHDGVLAIDKNRQVLVANVKARELLGINGSNPMCTVLPDNQKDLELYYLNGEKKVIRIYKSPLKQEGKEIGEVIVLRDVTRERELEEENSRKERLSAMGRMAVTVAHEIRNPLGSIELFAGLIKRGGTKEEIEKWASSIQKVTKSINNLISNMLMFTRPIYIEPQECNLKELVENCIDAAKAALKEKEISVGMEGDEVAAWVDPELIKTGYTEPYNKRHPSS